MIDKQLDELNDDIRVQIFRDAGWECRVSEYWTPGLKHMVFVEIGKQLEGTWFDASFDQLFDYAKAVGFKSVRQQLETVWLEVRDITTIADAHRLIATAALSENES